MVCLLLEEDVRLLATTLLLGHIRSIHLFVWVVHAFYVPLTSANSIIFKLRHVNENMNFAFDVLANVFRHESIKETSQCLLTIKKPCICIS